MKRILSTLLTVGLVSSAMADFVYVTSTPSNCIAAAECPSINTDININFAAVYDETFGAAVGPSD